MIIQFTLTMPNVGSWNGKWTGESNLYAITRKMKKAQADKVLEKSSYYYNFGDGWGADVSVKHIDAYHAIKVRKASRGFCAYDWMVHSIIDHGEILNTTQRKQRASV